ncbi:MAG TPA: DUF6770 family protein [Saprospiraceae bacterium]|nr:DUF6770 family protein [Saprospiraceae bacterium]
MEYFALITFFLAFGLINIDAQSISFPEDKGITVSNLYPMMINNELKGYYSFYTTGKVKSQWESNLLLMDINFKITKDATIVTDDWVSNIVFNGSHFCLTASNAQVVQYNIYDSEGKLTGKRKVDDMKVGLVEAESYTKIIPVPYQGFIRTVPLRAGEGSIEMLNNEGDVKWVINGKETMGKSRKVITEIINVFDVSDKHLLVYVYPRNSGDWSEKFIRAYDIQTGGELFELDVKEAKDKLVHGINLESNEIIRYGAYFPQGEPGVVGFEWGGSKHGFYLQIYDYAGNLKFEYLNNGEDEYKSLFKNPVEDGYDESSGLWIHNVLKSGSKYYMIGEMYANSPKSISNMMVIEFDTTQSKPSAYVFKKDIIKFGVKTGIMAFNFYNLAYNFKTMGLFDYWFSAQNAGHSMFSSVYANFDNSDKADKNYIVGAVALDRDGQLVNPKIVLTSKPDVIRLFPGKPGYVAVVEFFKKEKNVSLTLHKFDF